MEKKKKKKRLLLASANAGAGYSNQKSLLKKSDHSPFVREERERPLFRGTEGERGTRKSSDSSYAGKKKEDWKYSRLPKMISSTTGKRREASLHSNWKKATRWALFEEGLDRREKKRKVKKKRTGLRAIWKSPITIQDEKGEGRGRRECRRLITPNRGKDTILLERRAPAFQSGKIKGGGERSASTLWPG